jgi:hypothetical protein
MQAIDSPNEGEKLTVSEKMTQLKNTTHSTHTKTDLSGVKVQNTEIPEINPIYLFATQHIKVEVVAHPTSSTMASKDLKIIDDQLKPGQIMRNRWQNAL